MNINSDSTIAGKLTNIVRSSFPLAIHTKLSKDIGLIHTDPKSHGKAILFTWRGKDNWFKLTEALRVTQMDFKNDFITTPLAIEAQQIIQAHLHPVIQQAIEDQQAAQEIKTESIVS
jgi:hypothetical protein